MKKSLKILLVIITAFLGINVYALDCSTTLRNGSQGTIVKELQSLLNTKENCNLVVDGSFGALTKSCVQSYQAHNNLEVDGIVGPKTCNSLNNSTATQVVKEHPATTKVRGVVTKDRVNIRKYSSTSSQIVTTIRLGKVVRILSDTGNGWYRVKVDKNYGYIRKDLISKDCIIVDISTQKLHVYKNGQKSWSTNVVTGTKNSAPTPTGSYTLNPANFSRNVALQGKYPVDYWMPFILERGIGFHDASWRTSDQFNKTTYLNSGSHGCINMQHEAAEKLFTTITKSTNVVVRK